MKLWLQVLFVQGWLWRDRFPDKFPAADSGKRRLGWWVLLLWVPAVWVIVALDLASDRASFSALALTNAFVWLVWQCTALAIRPNVRGKQLWISLHWAAAFVAYILLLLALVVGIVALEWMLVLWSGVLLICSASHWLRGIQNNYLVFVDPVRNAWRLELPSLGKGFITPVARLIADAYWHLPRQILFPQKEHHAR